MESGRKPWVALLFACMFIAGAGIWLKSASANKETVKGTQAQSGGSPARITLHVDPSSGLHFRDAGDLEEGLQPANDNMEPVALAMDDFSERGDRDMAALYKGSQGAEVQIRLATPDGGFTSPTAIALPDGDPTAIVAGDFNRDGHSDLVVAYGASGKFSVLFGDGHGGFTQGPVVTAGGNITSLGFADLDRDGLNDLVVGDASGRIRIYFNTGDLSKVTPKTIQIAEQSKVVAIGIADFRNTHWKDIAVATDKGVFVLKASGGGEFGKPGLVGNAAGITGMTIGDFSGKYLPEIAVSEASGRVTVWHSRQNRGFSAPQSYPAEGSLTGITAGFFHNSRFADLAVAEGDHVSVLMNNEGHGFSEPMTMDVDSGAAALATGARQNGISTIAIARREGGLVVTPAATGATIVVSTTVDENDCPTCTSAQLAVFQNGTLVPGGGSGISLREAMTAANNDSVLPTPIVNDLIVFTGISTVSTTTHHATVPTQCALPVIDGGSGIATAANTYWLISTAAHGTLPPIIAPGLTIDGTQFTSGSTGVTNTIGPAIVVSSVTVTQQGAFILITSSGAGTTIKGLSLVGALGDAIQVAAPNCTITGNFIGLDCAGSVQFSNVNTGSGVDFLSGSVNEVVSNNLISNNGGSATNPDPPPGTNGITINGVSQSVSTPQNNVISNNTIGLDGHGRAGHNTGNGIMLQNGATGNTIKNNTISASAAFGTANIGFGIDVEGNITSDAIILNNKIGTDPTGLTTKDANGLTLGNTLSGVAIGWISGNPKFNTVSGNVISGNGVEPQPGPPPFVAQPPLPAGSPVGVGITMSSADDNAQFNVITSNLIGVNLPGSVQIPNATGGMYITGLANNNTIGGTSSTDGNQVSGNNGPGITLDGNANNNSLENNEIGPNSLGAGGGPPLDQVTTTPQTSNKGGGVLLSNVTANGPFANRFLTNVIAFNSNTNTGNSTGVENDSPGNFNSFSQNQIFLNPPNTLPTVAAINEIAGQQGMRNTQILSPTSPGVIESLINITSGTTITTTGQTTITGTADFLDNSLMGANINISKVEVFVSQRGSPSDETKSEAQAFLGTVSSFQVDPNNPTNNTVDWSASLVIPAPFLNPVQTPTLFLTATITTGDGSTSPLSFGFVPQFVSGGGGGGSTCSLTATPSSVTVAGTAAGTVATQNVTLTNAGTQSVSVSGITLNQSGTMFSFQIQSGAATPTAFAPFTLTAGQIETVIISFTPTSAVTPTAPATASLSINDTCGTLSVPITGTLSTAKISVIPSSLPFGSVALGQSSTLSLTIINFGSGPLNVATLTFSGGATGPFSISGTNPAPFTVGSDSLTSISVKFTPTAVGAVTGTLTIASNDPVNPALAVGLSGTGTSLTPPTVSVSQPAAGQVFSSGGSIAVTFSASSPSGATLVSYAVKLSTNGGASFTSVGSGVPATLVNNISVTAPNVSTGSAQIEVSVTDSNNNTGSGFSAFFTIGTPPSGLSYLYTESGKMKVSDPQGTIQTNAVLVVTSHGNETFQMTFNGAKWIVRAFETGSAGDTMMSLASAGSTITVEVQNPGGLTSVPSTVPRQ